MIWSTRRTWALAWALLVLALGGCSDDGVTSADTDATGPSDGSSGEDDGASQVTTTFTAGGDASGDGTGLPNDDSGRADTGPDTGDGDPSTGTSAEGTTSGDSSGSDDSGSDASSSGDTGVEPSSTGEASSSSGEDTGSGTLDLFDECRDDSQCQSGVCWDFHDYDALCFGAVCSVTCKEDQDCIDAYTDAGAPFPQGTFCGDDGRCDPVGAGVGSFACA
jgi:hypothetical protein